MRCRDCRISCLATPTGQRCPSCGASVTFLSWHEYQPIAELPLRMPVVDRTLRLPVIAEPTDEPPCWMVNLAKARAVKAERRKPARACSSPGISPASLPKDDPRFIAWKAKMRVARGIDQEPPHIARSRNIALSHGEQFKAERLSRPRSLAGLGESV